MTGSACATGCGRITRRPAWPGGALCASCASNRIRRHGRCQGCGQVRSLPGDGPGESPVCARCAGITEALSCRLCGADDDFRSLGRCRRCSLRIRLERLFDDGSGEVKPELVSFVAALGAMASPRGGLNWLNRTATVERIRAIATGVVPLSHDGLDTLAMSNGREHLRTLLVAHGVLPERDRYLAAYERWAKSLLASIGGAVGAPSHRRLSPLAPRPSALGSLRCRRSDREPLLDGAGADQHRGQALGLAPRARDRSGRLHPRRRRRLVRRRTHDPSSVPLFLELGHAHPAQRTARTAPRSSGRARGIPERQRLDLLGRFLVDDEHRPGRPRRRLPGAALCASAHPDQPPLRQRLRRQTNGPTLRIGDDLVPVPPALAALVRALLERPSHVSSAGHPDSDWLFPGGRAGQPIEPDQLAERLNRHGVTRAARTAALDALLATVPAPVLAKLIDRRPWRVAQRTQTTGDGLEELCRSTSTVLNGSRRNTRRNEYASPPVSPQVSFSPSRYDASPIAPATSNTRSRISRRSVEVVGVQSPPSYLKETFTLARYALTLPSSS